MFKQKILMSTKFKKSTFQNEFHFGLVKVISKFEKILKNKMIQNQFKNFTMIQINFNFVQKNKRLNSKNTKKGYHYQNM